MTILVTTGSGTVGRAVVAELAARGLQVKAGSRHPERLAASAQVTPVYFEHTEPASIAAALDGVDGVFALIPSAAELNPVEFMRPLIQAVASVPGRKLVLMTAILDATLSADFLQVEQQVQASGAPYVILRPNFFMDNFHGAWGAPIVQADVIPLPAADSVTAFIDVRDIAAAAASALQSAAFNGQIIDLSGPAALTYAQVAELISAAAGRTITYVPLSAAEFAASLEATGVDAEYRAFMLELFRSVREGVAAEVVDGVQRLTGRAPRTLAEYARDHAAAWQASERTA